MFLSGCCVGLSLRLRFSLSSLKGGGGSAGRKKFGGLELVMARWGRSEGQPLVDLPSLFLAPTAFVSNFPGNPPY